MKHHQPLSQEVTALADSRHGVVTTAELRSAGVSRGVQRRRLDDGDLVRVVRGVVAIPDLSDRLTTVAAIQLLHPGLVAERRTAAAIWGLDGFRDGDGFLNGPAVDLVGGRGDRCRQPELGRVRIFALPPQAVVTEQGIRVTSPTWTLGEVGAAPMVTVDLVELALESALRMELTTEAKLRWLPEVRQPPKWRGSAVLESALARRRPGAPPTGSYAETRFLQRVVRWLRLGDPERQVPIHIPGRPAPYRMDFVFRGSRDLDVEIDGTTHNESRDFDYMRDSGIRSAGFEVVRYAAARIEHGRYSVASALKGELSRTA